MRAGSKLRIGFKHAGEGLRHRQRWSQSAHLAGHLRQLIISFFRIIIGIGGAGLDIYAPSETRDITDITTKGGGGGY